MSSSTLLSAGVQLRSVGEIDKSITSENWTGNDPPASLFAYEYSKISRFAKNTVQLEFNERPDFGKTITVEIPRYGDLLGDIYVRVLLPDLSDLVPSDSSYLAWTATVGYALFESIELDICGTAIDVQSSVLMEIYDYLSLKPGTAKANNTSVGRYAETESLMSSGTGERELYVPLRFWFNESRQQYLPLAAMKSGPIKIVAKLRSFDDCVIYDGNTPPSSSSSHRPPHVAGMTLFVDYYMLTLEERNIIERTKQTYLIEQWQTMTVPVTCNVSRFKADLNFVRPVKEMVWVFVETESGKNNDWFNYGSRDAEQANIDALYASSATPPATIGQNLMSSMQFQLDGKVRFEEAPESYYRLVTPYKYHTNASDRNIYVMSFAEVPEKNQPTGSANFSRYDHIEMLVKMMPGNPECALHVFAKTYNILTFENGTPFLEFL